MANWGDFCTFCGLAMQGAFPRKCSNGHTTYASPVTVGVALQPVQCGERIALLCVRRNIEPHKGGLALPGGFADQHETARLTAPRELAEETPLHRSADQATYFFEAIGSSHDDRDPRRHTMYFYAFPPIPESDLAGPFANEEVQALALVFLSPDRDGLVDAAHQAVTLCFESHHKAAVKYLSGL